ncbi:MAG: cisplatin damage response ATP-dependent DNA ligase [Pseudomonadota bacterium]
MRQFAVLLDALALTASRNRKIDMLAEYFTSTPDPDRGIALGVITGELSFQNVKASKFKELIYNHVDEVLFKLSYDYVGDLAETISLLWPHQKQGKDLPSLSEIAKLFEETKKKDLPFVIEEFLNYAQPHERWALIKLATGGLRIGVSARLAKTALAKMGGVELQDIEEVWHGIDPPYQKLFDWLDGKTDKPEIKHTDTFHPLMLSNPIDEDKDFEKLSPQDFNAEWKWDGIRVQLVLDNGNNKLYSRTGDEISAAFPDITENAKGSAVLDGELLVGPDFDPLDFNCLQQRLNRKTVNPKHLKEYPAFVRVYDILFDCDEDIRGLNLKTRRERLEKWFEKNKQTHLDFSEIIPFKDWKELETIRNKGADEHGHEGVMIKLKSSQYFPGRPKGLWYKWKRDPYLVDAILMYGQRGHGKRSSFYSDFTFGVWKGNEIVPIGKAYFGFTDEELKELDKFVRNNTIERFGPVREVKKELVLEVAFDSAHESTRHKSGIALRFPRIHRIRWDKPAAEADTLETMQKFL